MPDPRIERDEFEPQISIPPIRGLHPLPLKADCFEGDKFPNTSLIADAHAAVWGENHKIKSNGILAGSMDGIDGIGAGGKSEIVGVFGSSKNGIGVLCKSESNEALHAETQSTVTAAIAAYQMNPGSNSAAFFAKHHGGGVAGGFEGNVFIKGELHVTGDIKLLNADIAEDFTINDATAEPGSVMIFDNEGSLKECKGAYDKKVAGVISGAGNYKPGMILDKQSTAGKRMPVALLGKVYCKADAGFGAIEVGDMLTTSATSGHAMVANDASKAFGTVIGKALKGLTTGRGLIPILVNLK